MTDEEFNQIVNACLGLDKPEAERTQAQRQWQNHCGVVKIPETSIKSHFKMGHLHFKTLFGTV